MCFSHFPVPRCQQVFLFCFLQRGLAGGGGGGTILERRKPGSWFTHFLQRFTIKWDEEISDAVHKQNLCVSRKVMFLKGGGGCLCCEVVRRHLLQATDEMCKIDH